MRHFLLLLSLALGPSAGAQELPGARATSLALFVGAGYLGSPTGDGAALSGGVRLAPCRWLALGFDLGYGLIGPYAQDRWWLIPSVALVVGGPVRIDLGAGVGLGTSTGFASLADWTADRSTWENQLVPAARAHATAALAVGARVELFTRVEMAALLLEGNTLGVRTGDARAGLAATTWVHLSVGARWEVL